MRAQFAKRPRVVPQGFSDLCRSWVGDWEREKRDMMTDIDGIYARATAANVKASANLLAFQRMAAATGAVAAGAFVVLGVGAGLLLIGTGGLAAAGMATGEEVAAALVRTKGVGLVVILYNS